MVGVKGEATLPVCVTPTYKGASVCIGRGANGGLPLYQTATCDKKSTSDYSHTACLSVTASSDAALTGVAIYVWHQIMILAFVESVFTVNCSSGTMVQWHHGSFRVVLL